MYLNKAFIIGNLTRDPELRSLPSGVQVTTFGVATNRVWKDKEGARQESTEFHNIVVFGRQAETSAQYLKKGSSVLIEGRLQTRSWESDGVKKYRTEIVADRVQFGARQGSTTPSDEPSGKSSKPSEDTVEYPQEEINPDDIPF
ncbi:single-stranded DNA-binding protein [Patescibacteria group bacterium]|nr:single-stranded DNA-binding protein [Patescibacteria group bacterium]